MTASGALALARRNLSRNRRGAALSALGVAIGVGCLTFFTGLGAGITSVVRTRVFPADSATIEVVPPHISLGALFGGGRLDEPALARLRAIPGVTQALPKMSVRVSSVSQYNGNFFGQQLHMGLEIMAVGVDPQLVAADLESPERFVDPAPGGPLPVVVSTQLLELYNKSFAVQRNLPELSPRLLIGFRFPVEFGRSFVAATDGKVQPAVLQVVGFSPHALLGGVTVPLATARRLNREHGLDAETYSSVVLRAESPDRLPAIANEVRREGFDIDDSQQKLGEQVGWGILVVTLALGLLSLLITLLAAVNIAHAFYSAVRERRREIGILRSVGASQRDVLRVLLTEAGMVGVGGSLAGIGAGVAASLVCDLLASRLLPDFPFKPHSFFHFPPLMLVGAFAVGVLASLVGAFPPARSAAHAEPAAALSE